MYLHEILSDVRAWLALGIFCTGAAFGLALSMLAWLYDKWRERKK